MNDLILGIVLLAGLSVLLFLLGRRLGRTLPVRLVKATGVTTLVALAAYVVLLSDSVLLATALPVSNLIVVGNWTLLLLSLLAGLAWSLIPRQTGATTPETASTHELGSGTGGPSPSDDEVPREPSSRRTARTATRMTLSETLLADPDRLVTVLKGP